MKRTVIWVLTLLMILCLTTTAFASDKLVINQNNVQEVLAEAEKGDKLAIEALQKLAIFDEEKVDKALKGVTFSSLDGPKTISFDDGSSIRIEFSTTITRSSYLKSCSYIWELAGLDVARYTIGAEWHNLSLPDYCTLDDHWDTSSAWMGATAYESGTTAPVVSGTYVKVTGTGGFDQSLIHVREDFEFIGYPYGDCQMTML